VDDGADEDQAEDGQVVGEDGSGRGEIVRWGHQRKEHLVVAALMERVIRQYFKKKKEKNKKENVRYTGNALFRIFLVDQCTRNGTIIATLKLLNKHLAVAERVRGNNLWEMRVGVI
jgi:hypothetical protein